MVFLKGVALLLQWRSKMTDISLLYEASCDSCGRADDHLHATPDGEQICTRCKLVRQRIDLIDRKGELEAEIRVLGVAIGELL